MNLYESITACHAIQPELNADAIRKHLKEFLIIYNIEPRTLGGINKIQAAVLLAHAGNLGNALSEREYQVFHEFCNRAMAAINARIKKDAFTQKIVAPILKGRV